MGAANRWRYGTGTIDGTGAMTSTSETTPSGTTGLHVTGWTASVVGNGIVSMSGEGTETFEGFLSDDKKTFVGTFSDGDGAVHKLMIGQVTGQTYTAGPVTCRNDIRPSAWHRCGPLLDSFHEHVRRQRCTDH